MATTTLKVTLKLNKNGSITTSWNSVSGAVKYKATLAARYSSTAIYNRSDLKTTTYTSDANLPAGKEYYANVYAFNSTKQIAYGTASIEIPWDYYYSDELGIPQNIKAEAGTTTIKISFSEVFRATDYDINFDGTVYTLAKTTASTKTRTFTGLKPKTSHTYAVRARNSTLTGAYSTKQTIRTAAELPATPTGIKKTATGNSATISWNAVSGATGYELLFNGSTYSVSGTSKTITGLKAATGYNFQVRAKNSDGYSNYSASYTVTTAPNAPASVTASSTTNSVTVNWTAVTGASGYNVKFDGKDYGVAGTAKTFSGLQSKTSHTYQVCSKSVDGAGNYSSAKTIMTQALLPAVPSGITKKSTENSAVISWNTVSGATGYDLKFNGSNYSVSANSKTVTGLAPNTSYNYQVRSKNANGVSEYSPVQSVRTTPKAPGTSSAVTNENSATLNWDAVAGATGYDVLFNGKSYSVTSPPQIITGLAANASYSYQVCAKNSDGSSSYSTSKTIKTAPMPPASPNVTATKNSAAISWGAVSGATSYDVLFDDKTYRVTGTSKTITGLTPSTNHKYSVRSNNSGGSSSYSTTKNFTTLPNAPSTPTNIEATSTVNSATIKWGASVGADSYELIFNNNTYETAGTSKTITGLTENTSYSYKLRAKNAGGTSAYSAVKSIKTLISPPGIPTNIIAVPSYDSVKISWNASSKATGYDLVFNGTTYSVTGTSKTITGLTQNTSYSYKVRAKNAGGTSAYSSAMTVKTLQKPPATPANVTATSTMNSVTVNWSASSGATGYDVMFNGSAYSVTGTSKTFTALTAATDYSYSVRAKNAAGTSSYSASKIIRTKPEVPKSPTNVSAAAKADSVIINWDKAAGADSYTVKFNNNIYDNITKNSKEITGLVPNTQYSYSVSAKNVSGSSGYSSTQSVRTLLKKPGNVRVGSTSKTVLFKFDAVDGATGYNVVLNGKNYDTTVPQLEISNLEPDTSYSCHVRAKNSYVAGEDSDLITVVTRKKIRKGSSKIGARKKGKGYPTGEKQYIQFDPVNAITGAFFWAYTWLKDYGNDNLDFTTIYDSQMDYNPNILGNKWTHSLNYLLIEDGGYVFFITPYGDEIPFKASPDNKSFEIVEGTEAAYTMKQNADGTYSVSCMDNTEYIFDAGMRLKQIIEDGMPAYNYAADTEGKINAISGKHRSKIKFSYKDGQIEEVSDIAGNKIIFGYDNGLLVSITNAEGNSIKFAYGENGNLITISDFAGTVYLCNKYDAKDRVIEQKLAGRGSAYAEYDESNNTSLFTDELGNQTKFTGDADGEKIFVEIGKSRTKSVFNKDGQLIQWVDALDNPTQIEYDERGRLTRIVHPDDTYEQAVYNENNQPVKLINRDGTQSLYEYDTRNNLIYVQDERGSIGRYTYDANDNLIGYSDRNGSEWSYTYDSNNHLKQAVDPEGGIYLYAYDEAGRLISYTSPKGRKISYKYSAVGNLLCIEDTEGSILFDYDENGSRIGITDKAGSRRSIEYNEMGQISLVTDCCGNEYRFDYDERGNLVSESDPLDYVIRHSYDAYGNQIEYVDCNGNSTTYLYDAQNQLIAVKNADESTVRYVYDAMGQVKTVIDPLEREIAFAYDKEGRVISETDALGNSISYTYDECGNMLTKTDENGAVISYTYDKENRIESVASESGVVSFTYDKLGHIIKIEDALGYADAILYDTDGNITSFVDKEKNETSYEYDVLGRVVRTTAPNGGKTSYTYDKNGNCTSITDAEENTYLYEYDKNNRIVKETDPLGNETSYEYDARGKLICITAANEAKTNYEYDGNGNVVKEINPLGGIRTYYYDSMNRLINMVDEEGYEQSFVYDVVGNVTSYTDANKNKWLYDYDALDRIVKVTGEDEGCLSFEYTNTGKVSGVTDQEGAKTSYLYDAVGRLTELSDAMGHKLSFTYDSMGRLLTQTDAAGNTTQYNYSPAGNLISVTDAGNNNVTYAYDALGKVISETDADGNTISYEYDLNGRMISITDALGAKTSFAYNAVGQIASVTDAAGGVTLYGYDACGNIRQIINPLGSIAMFEYDAMNNQIKEYMTDDDGQEQMCATLYYYDKRGCMVREINPVSDELMYSYDGNGNITDIIDEDGAKTTVHYDLNNKPVQMTYNDGNEVLFRYNKRGELVELRDWNGISSMEHDALGRMIKMTDHNGRTVGYSYDVSGRRTGITYPDGKTAGYSYDKCGRLIGIKDVDGHETVYTYAPNGDILSIKRPGSIASYSYNANRQPVKIKYQLNDGTYMDDSIAYDVMGRIVSSERKGSIDSLTRNAAYAYDALGRLISVNEGINTRSYTYDAFGNRMSKNINGTEKAVYGYDEANRLISMTQDGIPYSFTYDKRGNLTHEYRNGNLMRRYTYDSTNHMTLGENLESGEQTEYGYNGLYARINNTRTIPEDGSLINKKTSYLPDYLSESLNDLMAYDDSGKAERSLFGFSYEKIAQNNIYFQPDLLGSPLFSTDVLGNLTGCSLCGVWGEADVSVYSAGFTFTNYIYDPVIDKHFAQARFYDSVTGRMCAKDPVKRGFNLYLYCGGDPLNYEDHTGEILNILAGAAIGGIVGGAIGFLGSAIDQKRRKSRFSMREAIGSAAKGAIVGAAKGALVSSGAGPMALMAGDFAAGVLGSIVEQKINKNKHIDRKKAIRDGLVNSIGGALFGNDPFYSVVQAFRRGASSGAATSVIDYIFDTFTPSEKKQVYDALKELPEGTTLIITINQTQNDPKVQCPNADNMRYDAYGNGQSENGRQFSLKELFKEALLGALLGGVSGAAFYGGGMIIKRTTALQKNESRVRYKKYMLKNGLPDWSFAPHNGEMPGTRIENQVLKAGTIVDRYGGSDGKYVSPVGTSFKARALPYVRNPYAYHMYVLQEDLENVTISRAAKAFGQKGGGIQYMLDKKVKELGDSLKEIEVGRRWLM